MAHEPDLKTLYRGMAADEAEMSKYRRNLKSKLPTKSMLGRWWLPTLAVVGLTAISFMAWWPPAQADLFDKNLEGLRAMAVSPDAGMWTQKARLEMNSGEVGKQLNASAFLCMVLPYAEAAPVAAKALQQEPRAEFRVFYLETLLDEADEYQINVDLVEKLMDGEEDELCFRLYSALLELG